jgi:DNA-binding transcriptional LysR family regulator
MNIDFLRNFIKLYEYKNFSELAKALNISQSTLSHQISQIEKQLGEIKLINRTTRSFELTEEGNIFLDFTRKIIDLYDSCLHEIKLNYENKTEAANINITASTLPGSHILPKFLANFKNENPNVNFKIGINNSLRSINNLIDEEADFAAIGSFMDKDQVDFDIIKIGEENLVFICSPNHALIKSGKKSFNSSELIKFPFISREKGSGTRDIIEQQFNQYKKLNISLEINDNDSIISAVSESNNIAIISEIIAKKAQDAGLIKILEIEDYSVIANRDIFLIKKKGRNLSNLKQKFWDYLQS